MEAAATSIEARSLLPWKLEVDGAPIQFRGIWQYCTKYMIDECIVDPLHFHGSTVVRSKESLNVTR